MGLFSSIFGSSSTKSVPKWAKPYVTQGLQQTQNVFNTQQPRLEQMSQTAQDAFDKIAPGAFGTNPYIANAQAAAGTIGDGHFLGKNPGQATYERLQGKPPAMSGGQFSARPGYDNGPGAQFGMIPKPPIGGPAAQQGDPSTGLLSMMANDRSGGAGDAMLRSVGQGGSNPADAFASAVAQGQYLNRQPSSGLYAGMMDPSYAKANPFLDDMIRQTGEDVRTQANRMFASRGMGSGLSSAFGDILTRNLADSGNSLRYQNYNDAENRRLAAAGQSDAAWSGERSRMDASTGLLSGNYNAGQDRALAAAQALNQGGQQSAQQRLAAAQSLGGQYNAGADRALERYSGDANRRLQQYGADQDRALSALNSREDRALQAASASDAAQQAQIQQILASIGMAPGLREAEYAGVSPALALLNSAATIPWTGVNAYNGGITSLYNGYGTTKNTPSVMDAISQTIGAATAGKALYTSDRRLKSNVEKVGELEDGLGVYDFDYVWGGPRQRGVMADEVERLRPWALGPRTREGYATVDYGALG